MRRIDLFTVPPHDDEAFLADWESERVEPGVLYRALRPDADFRFVAVVRWSSPLMVARTLQQPEAERAIASIPFPGHPALYLPHAGGP